MDKITIVVVCYNETPDRIRYTFDSIIEQDYLLIECVVVDGGSQTDTIEAFKSYFPQIEKFISESDNGIYDAMNKGIRASKGDWIIFINIGDRFHDPAVLTSMMNKLYKKSGDLIFGDILRDDKVRTFYPNKLTKQYLCFHSICHQAILARRSVFNVVGAFDTSFRLAADREWVFRALKAGFRFIHIPIVVCDWELGGACSDIITEKRELQKYRAKYFTLYERKLYECLWVVRKVFIRIKKVNFAIPVKLKGGKILQMPFFIN